MFLALLISALVCAHAQHSDVQQYVKSVKGGGGGWQYNPSVNYDRFYGQGYNMQQNASHVYNWAQNTTQHGFGAGVHNTTRHIDYEIGVCYIEVPTASLARDPKHVPAGNGSRPDLSRIRTCCQGYIRNIHNFRICDPVCSQDCVNALCSAPETCTCFPDHVKNLGGFCIPTCPIGCQNGHCAGGECLCKQGYKLDSESRFCIPACKENCGGIGNCTSPNKCDCKPGYQSTPEGSCKPVCNRCDNGECVAPNDCRCLKGYVKSDAGCKPACDLCRNGDCVGPNTCRCHPGYVNEQPGTCVPQCTPGCGPSSRCVAPNVCDPPLTTSTSTTPATHITALPSYPLYPGNQVQPNPSYPGYPGNQGQPNPSYPGYPGNQGHPNPSYPGYPDNQQQPNPSYPGYPSNQGHPSPAYPGHQPNPSNPLYPGNHVYPSTINATGLTEEMCAQPCINGICVGLNTCRCKPGYYVDPADPTGTRCVPHCAGGCVNGVCSAPNFCICNMGYYKDTSVKGRPTCVKRIRRSADLSIDAKKPVNVAELLIFEIP